MRCALAPVLQHDRRRRGHLVREACDIVVVKGRLQQATLALPEFPVAGQQTLARDQPDEGRAARLFVKVALILLQDVLDVVGMVEQMNHVRAEPKADDIAESAR